MSRRGSSFFGRESPAGAAARAAQDGAVAAFLDLDTRQRYVSEAVDAIGALRDTGSYAAALTGRGGLESAWDAIEQRCFAASSHYLAVAQQYPPESAGSHSQQAATAYGQVHLELAQAAGEIDAFYQANRQALDHANQAVAATPAVARAARELAAGALERALGDAAVAGYPSVVRAQQDLDQACATLDRASSVADTRRAAEEVTAKAHALDGAVKAAGGAGQAARTALSSVRTRIDALNTRTGRLAETNSALLREFSAASSRDLSANIGLARQHLAEGEQDWQAARDLLGRGDAEQALARLHDARNHLAESETAARALTDRLDALREVKADPEGAVKKVRFKIRDAQRLVVDRGLIPEWGSVLDSQMARLDRAVDGLTGVHPDYWSYLSELGAITAFVSGVVDRVRGQVSGR
ncbi:hypothetical protein D1871_00115 [Nakamurella silvestris]|nr:hypothetical protein D1871_00115 [Nakamurella silvestris]